MNGKKNVRPSQKEAERNAWELWADRIVQKAGAEHYRQELHSARPKKKKSASRTELTRLLQYKDINGMNRLFGGRLMEWIDEAAGTAAMRHCGGDVTTASVDTLVFEEGAYLNELIVLIATVTYVGRTSMEVRVDTFSEEKATGVRRLINHAYLTEVHVDKEGNPVEVPCDIELENEQDSLEWEGAKRRIVVRRERRKAGF